METKNPVADSAVKSLNAKMERLLYLQILFTVLAFALMAAASAKWSLIALGLALAAGLYAALVRRAAAKGRAEERTQAMPDDHQSLKTVLDMLPFGVRIIRIVDGTLIYANKAMLKVFAADDSVDSSVVKGRSMLDFMPERQPDGRKTVDVINELFRSDAVNARVQIQCRKANGNPFPARVTSCRINYQGIPASLSVIEDVTVEQEYQQTLQNIASKEREANQLKSRFIATVSHEIRTPMNTILGIAEIQLQNNKLPPEYEDAFALIHNSGDLLLNIINDVLDLSKIEEGKLEIMAVKYDIASLVNDTAQLNQLRYDSKPLQFNIHVDENTPLELFGDELRIKQILNNLLSNAFKYTCEGEVALSVSAERGEKVEVFEEVTLVLRVSDTGQGMTAEQIDRLFDEFTRFNPETNREIVGAGLGMSITKRLVDMMGGRISVESMLGKGTVFTVRLPQRRIGSAVCGAELNEGLRRNRFKSASKAKKLQVVREHMPYGKVLIVDDVESNLFVARGLMLPYGLKIETAASGFEAVEKIKDGNVYDIVFMDHMMPQMDGMAATKIIRSAGYARPIVALTANAVAGQSEIFLASGFDGFISKPIDIRQLNATLNRLIRDRKPPEVIEAARQRENGQNEDESARKKPANNILTRGSEAKPAPRAPADDELMRLVMKDVQNAIAALEEMLPLLKSAPGDADMELFTTTVHGIKSALANIGETDLSDTALKLEQAGHDRDTATIALGISVFLDKIRALVARNIGRTQLTGGHL